MCEKINNYCKRYKVPKGVKEVRKNRNYVSHASVPCLNVMGKVHNKPLQPVRMDYSLPTLRDYQKYYYMNTAIVN